MTQCTVGGRQRRGRGNRRDSAYKNLHANTRYSQQIGLRVLQGACKHEFWCKYM